MFAWLLPIERTAKTPDQIGRMPRLIRVFAGHTCHFVGFVMRWLISKLFVLTHLKILTVIISKHQKIAIGCENEVSQILKVGCVNINLGPQTT